MPRVLVCGCSGSGKSTFAGKLGVLLGLTPVSLDALFWLPGWVESDSADFRARASERIAAEHWIVDGNFFSDLGDLHLSRATHVVYFDLPRWLCMTGALLRIAKGYGRTRPEMAPGCPERFDRTFLTYIWRYRRHHRPKHVAILRAMRPDQRRIVFHARSEAEDWLCRVSREGLNCEGLN